MGVFRPIVERAQAGRKESTVEPSDKLITPANIMTASRPVLAGIAAWMLVTGRRGATVVAGVAGATDMEGKVASVIDKKWPASGRGSSVKGVRGDPVADAAMLAEIGAGVMLAPKVSRLGKLATVIIVGQEAHKAQEAIRKNATHTSLTGEPLVIPADLDGKEAMVEKMIGEGFAILTSETENSGLRLAFGMAAVGFAVSGTIRGYHAHQQNMERADQAIAAAQIAA